MTVSTSTLSLSPVSTFLREKILPIVMMSSLGLFYWAIRGTGDYGGMMGGVFAGLGWAVCCQFLSKSRDGKARPFRRAGHFQHC